jgi:hypothetical protein
LDDFWEYFNVSGIEPKLGDGIEIRTGIDAGSG